MTEVGTGPISGTKTASLQEAQKGMAAKQPSFDWNAPNKYLELLYFEMEVRNIPETKMYIVTEEEEVPIIKNWVGREGSQLIQTFTIPKRSRQNSKRTVLHVW